MPYRKIFIVYLLKFLCFNLLAIPEVKVIPIPGNVNTDMQEFAPSLTADGKTMYFYSKRNNSKYTDLYKSTLVNGKWTSPIELRALNSPYDDQSPFVADDEKFIVFSSNRDGSIEFKLANGKIGVSRDIYYAESINGKWTKASSLSDKINTEEMEENPFLHENDIYFTRYPFGNPGEAKIWKAKIKGNHLQEPEELPSPINDGSSNIAAVISKDGKYIYFASNRAGGYGGYDIYRSKIEKNGMYGDPENLGPEINTKGDEAYMIIDKANNAFYFCRKNPNENYDIYTALILKDDSEEPKLAIKETPIRDKPIDELKVNPSPKEIEIPSVVDVPKKELPKKEDISKEEINKTLKDKKKLNLNNVHFDTNSSDILSESFPVLNQIADFLKENPETKIKITGHTDLTGDVALNKILSLERAESVRAYLSSKGINRNRMIADGKGSTQPIINNLEPESNRLNRRTEFQVVE